MMTGPYAYVAELSTYPDMMPALLEAVASVVLETKLVAVMARATNVLLPMRSESCPQAIVVTKPTAYAPLGILVPVSLDARRLEKKT